MTPSDTLSVVAPAPAKKAQKKTSEAPSRLAATPPPISSGTSVSATPGFALSIAKSGEGSGIVTSVPEGIHCGSSCSRVFAEGKRLVVRATPDSGSWFDGWLNCDGIGECALTLSADTRVTASFSRLPASPSSPSVRVMISEILYDAAGSDEGKEFIELYNAGDAAVELDGWSLSNGDKSLAKIGSKSEDKTTIPARGFFLVGLNGYAGTADAVRSASLPNTSAALILKNSEGVVMEETRYGEGALAAEKNLGVSLEKRVWEGAALFVIQPNPNPQNSQSPPQ